MLIGVTQLLPIDTKKPIAPKKACEELEAGNILFLPECPFPFSDDERAFLLTQKQSASAKRKNIAYKPGRGVVTNSMQTSSVEAKKLMSIMRAFSQRTVAYLSELLAPYAPHWQVDYASFRPFQEEGRALRTRARNDLLHTDAFPSRPMHGRRILRFFVNINPNEARCWITSDSAQTLAKRYGNRADGIPLAPSFGSTALHAAKQCLRRLGFSFKFRSPYDAFMLRMHNFLKENRAFQETCRKDHWAFPPGSCWLVFTDQVSHAVLAGQYALEQTLLIPHRALLSPSTSPLGVLETLAGTPMVSHEHR